MTLFDPFFTINGIYEEWRVDPLTSARFADAGRYKPVATPKVSPKAPWIICKDGDRKSSGKASRAR